MAYSSDTAPLLPSSLRARLAAWLLWLLGHALLAACIAGAASLLTWSVHDPSFTRISDAPPRNLLGPVGATFADLTLRLLGLAGVFVLLPPMFWALQLVTRRRLDGARLKLTLAPLAVLLLAAAASSLPRVATWPVPFGLGGFLGDQALQALRGLAAAAGPERAAAAAGAASLCAGIVLMIASLGLSLGDLRVIWQNRGRSHYQVRAWMWARLAGLFRRRAGGSPIRREPTLDMPPRSSASDHIAAWRAGPSFNRRVRPASSAFARDNTTRLSEPGREAEFDGLADTDCHAMARRFAPEPPEPEAPPGRDRRSARAGGATRRFSPFRPFAVPPRGEAGQKPIWPGSVPEPPEDVAPEGPRRRPPGEDLYVRAVAIVRSDRKASTEYLQQRLGIRYMRAADLIERMEQEGILGAPVRNGTRPILRRPPRTRVV
jgi:4TM region of DNA translocase FtsK/SpoIIIE/Ftsk gamma domain